jgi:Arc/MetJ family transcription regulator
MFGVIHTHEGAMRTNIEIDDELLRQAMKATGQTTKKATVETALRQAVQSERRRRMVDQVHGKYPDWGTDYKSMRVNPHLDE